jgi:hypothetical protein
MACRQDDGEHIHASRDRNNGAVEKSKRNKAQTTEVEDPVPRALGDSGCCGRDHLMIEHFLAKSVSFLVRRMCRFSEALPFGARGQGCKERGKSVSWNSVKDALSSPGSADYTMVALKTTASGFKLS